MTNQNDNYSHNYISDTIVSLDHAQKGETPMKNVTLLLLFLFLTLTLQAQRILSLDSCKAMALRNQVSVRNALLDVEAAQHTKTAAFTRYFPTISATAGYFHSFKPLIDVSSSETGATIDVTASYNGIQYSGDYLEQLIREELDDVLEGLNLDANLKMLDHGAFAGVMAMQPILAGGRILNGNKLAQLGIDVAETQLLMTQDEVTLNTEEKYYQIILLQEQLKTIEQALSLLDTLERDAASATNAGVISRNELLKVQLKQKDLMAAKMQLDDGINMSQRALKQYIGLDNDTQIQLLVPEEIAPLLINDADFNKAEHRKEFQLLEAAIQAEELKGKMVLGESRPQLAVGATYGYSNVFGNKFSGNGILFASFSLPLTSWAETNQNYLKQEIARKQAENRKEDLRQQMILQQTQAANEVNQTFQQLGNREDAVALAQQNLEEVRNYYVAGMVGTSDYLEALTLYQQTQNDLVDQRITYLLKLSRYKQLTR